MGATLSTATGMQTGPKKNSANASRANASMMPPPSNGGPRMNSPSAPPAPSAPSAPSAASPMMGGRKKRSARSRRNRRKNKKTRRSN